MLLAAQPELKALTGVKVSLEAIPEQQQRQEMVLEFASGSPSFGVCNLSIAVQKRLVERGHWFADLRPFMDAMSHDDPAFDAADFSPAIIAYGSDRDGTLEVLPTSLDYWVVYYNKDLLSRTGAAYPETIDDLVSACAAVKKLGGGAL